MAHKTMKIGALALLAAVAQPLWAAAADGMPAALRAAVEATQRRVEPDGPGRYSAANPANRFALRFGPEAVEVAPAQQGGGWRFGLRLGGYGAPGAVKPVAPAVVSATDSRVEYRRGKLTEWYENRPEGLEQGFTLAEPPAAGGEAVLALQVEGGLRPKLKDGAQALSLHTADGAAVLNYRELKVTDAQGKTLPARLALAGDAIQIQVDARGAAWPVTVDPLVNSAQTLTASDGATGDYFGYSVALSGNTALVGAFGKNSHAGAAYVYVRSGAAWSQQQKLTAADAASNDSFGAAVALYGDTALVGAWSKNSNTGAAYIYTRSGSVWTQQKKLTGAAASDLFGQTVALSGGTALIGAPGRNSSAGAAYVYTGSGASWTLQQTLAGVAGDSLGVSVALSGDTALVGAQGRNSAAGAAIVYTRSGATWTQQQVLTASNSAANDLFGYAVALSGDTALVGTQNKNAGYVYTRSGTAWAQQQILVGADTKSGDYFGISTALSGDTALVGAFGTGAAYVFTRSGTAWTQQQKLTGVAADDFGYAVALSGATALVGAYGKNSLTGAAFAYTFPCAFGTPITTNQWQMIASPCQPATATVDGTFGGGSNFPSADYDSNWVLYTFDPATNAYAKSALTDPVAPGTGFWLDSLDTPTNGSVIIASGSATPATTGFPCNTTNGCYSIPLTPSTDSTNRYNLVGNPFPYGVDWSKVLLYCNNSSFRYTPSAAEAQNLMAKTFWVWNGNSYDVYDDSTPGMVGTLPVFKSFWVKLLPGAAATCGTIQLLIPATATTTSQAAPTRLPWYLAWLDWIAPPAAADTLPNGGWYVRLSVENPQAGFKDSNNLLGQLLDAKDGYDSNDLAELKPFAAPYLTLVFPHPEWGAQAGDYASDYRPAQGGPTSWNFEIRADQPGAQVWLRWQGDPKILARSLLLDADNKLLISPTNPRYANGLAVSMTGKTRRFTWRYLGQ